MQFLKRMGGVGRARALFVVLPLLVKVAWRLARDPRVQRRHKAVLLLAAGYAVSPIDIAPDFLPYIGRLDDAIVLAAGVAWAMKFAPPLVVEEHLSALGTSRTDLARRLAKILPPPLDMAMERLSSSISREPDSEPRSSASDRPYSSHGL